MQALVLFLRAHVQDQCSGIVWTTCVRPEDCISIHSLGLHCRRRRPTCYAASPAPPGPLTQSLTQATEIMKRACGHACRHQSSIRRKRKRSVAAATCGHLLLRRRKRKGTLCALRRRNAQCMRTNVSRQYTFYVCLPALEPCTQPAHNAGSATHAACACVQTVKLVIGS